MLLTLIDKFETIESGLELDTSPGRACQNVGPRPRPALISSSDLSNESSAEQQNRGLGDMISSIHPSLLVMY